MATHKITLRLTQEEFEAVSALAEQMKCTNREVFTTAIRDKNVNIQPIIEQYWKEKEHQHFREYFECSADRQTMWLLQKLGDELKRQTAHIKEIGTQVNQLMKKIPMNGMLSCKDDKLQQIRGVLDAIYADDEYFLYKQQQIEKMIEEIVDGMHHVQFRLQRKY